MLNDHEVNHCLSLVYIICLKHTMGMLKDKKLNQLIQSWPKDAVLTSEWIIHKMGYTKSHLQKYSRSGWIKLIGKGAYVCTGIDNQGIPLKKKQKIEWQSGVYAMQALHLNQKTTELRLWNT